MTNPFKRLMLAWCLFRNEHHYIVSDLHEFLPNHEFRGVCDDCGCERTRTGREWQRVLHGATQREGRAQ